MNSLVRKYLAKQLALKIKQHVTCIHRCSHGLNFLGMRIFPGYIRVKRENRKKSLKKISDKLQTYEQQLTSEYFYDDPGPVFPHSALQNQNIRSMSGVNNDFVS
jgi:hypothetical protein